MTMRIGKMARSNAERGLDHVHASLHLGSRRRRIDFLEHDMIDRVRSNGDKRVTSEPSELVPGQTKLAAERRRIDSIAPGNLSDHAAALRFILEAMQQPINGIKYLALIHDAFADEW